MLPPPVQAVVERPRLRSLVLGVPLAELVTKLNTRSMAPAFSSSRLAPLKTASNLPSVMVSSSAVVCWRFREARGPVSSVTRPASIDSWTLVTTSRAPSSATRRSR